MGLAAEVEEDGDGAAGFGEGVGVNPADESAELRFGNRENLVGCEPTWRGQSVGAIREDRNAEEMPFDSN